MILELHIAYLQRYWALIKISIIIKLYYYDQFFTYMLSIERTDKEYNELENSKHKAILCGGGSFLLRLGNYNKIILYSIFKWVLNTFT